MTPRARSAGLYASALVLALFAAGCAAATIAVKERLGIPKRDQLVSGVQRARDSQVEAKQQFESALAEFIAVTGATDKNLEAKYTKLQKSYNQSEQKAQAVRDRIDNVDRVSRALFKEWNAELAQYSDPNLRRTSERELTDTRAQYDRLIAAMRTASAKMDPVLAAFKDQVLFLKHNLNARAVASLKGQADDIQADVGRLIREMEASIAEANSFIAEMQPAQ